jgi:hypothetical protein
MTPVGTEVSVGGTFGVVDGAIRESARVQIARVTCEMPECVTKGGSGRVIKRRGRNMGVGQAGVAEVYQVATEHDNEVHDGDASPKLLKVDLTIGH